ncbi:MAG TPA: M13 family metallopeptidase [Steroidobacteraceae bacterium]|jgi:predicted metalloendopeptidase|nr:M13 family metallopeptidase [Steroidobacteraceae bacterium]
MKFHSLALAIGLLAAAATSSGRDLPAVDASVRPGDAFYQYVNGAWLKATEIPADRSAMSDSALLSEEADRRTREIIQQTAQDKNATADAKKIADFYNAFMDEASIEKLGLEPLGAQLRAIASISDRKSLSRLLGSQLRADVDVLNSTNLYTGNLLGLWVAQDLDDPSRYVAFLLQGGLGMPDRDYYLDASPSTAAIRAAYTPHLAKVLALANVKDAPAKAARIFELEKRMATVHGPRVETFDVVKANNHWTRKTFDTKAPGLDWQEYFAAAGLGKQTDFIVWQPAAVTGLSALVASQPLETWKEYLTVRLIEHASSYLPKAFVDERFEFYSKTLQGTPKPRDRWKRGIAVTNVALGDAIGKLYAARYFAPAEKARAEAMVHNLIAAFARRIEHLEWMAPETKAKAKAKLAVLKIGVGYPDHWIDYSALDIRSGDALGNALRAELFETHRNLAKLGKPVDRSEWVMTPQTVNAVNLPVMNAMNFPAAILQPPYFDPKRPGVMDYGAMGATIGHEISHSFDDQGAQFDATGKLHNWWTPEDFAHFKEASQQLAKQYDQYRPFPDLALNGQQVLSENIADLAGLAVTYDAWKLSLNGKAAPVVDGFTGDQQFFMSFAQSWRAKAREPALRQQVITDGHAPDEYRADTVRNLDAWYQAFDVKAGEKLYLAPGQRVRIW